MMRGLKGKVAIVAGGATGIGAATAERLAEHGARIVVGDINIAGAEALVARINASGGEARAVRFDISDDESVGALVAAAVETYGGLDAIHVNAADLSLCAKDPDVLALDLAIFDRTIAINLRGHLLCTRHAVPELLKRGGGSIVYTSSGAAFVGEAERVSYAISKAGINALMRHVASRWGKENIRSNAIAPGLVLTDGAKSNIPPDVQAMLIQQGRSPRLGVPTDIAAMAVYLMSDDGVWINGQVISVDGGITMR
jgi:NAD(P)-dependent dehydrogenase (short-subunit alcohol dehydrogenase family)